MNASSPAYALTTTWRFLVLIYSWAVLLVIATPQRNRGCHQTRGLPFSSRLDLLGLSFFSHVSPLLQLAGRFGAFAAAH